MFMFNLFEYPVEHFAHVCVMFSSLCKISQPIYFMDNYPFVREVCILKLSFRPVNRASIIVIIAHFNNSSHNNKQYRHNSQYHNKHCITYNTVSL